MLFLKRPWILLSILSTLAPENASAGKLQKTFLRVLHLLDVPPRDDQGDDLGIRPDGRKRVRAAEAADDGGIRRVEQLLHDAAQRDRQREPQQFARERAVPLAAEYLLRTAAGLSRHRV